jgi:hypothetical protein
MRPSKECFYRTLLLGPGPRPLQPVEDFVAVVDTRSRFMLANEHQRICKRTDDPSVTQMKRGVDGDLSWVHHGTTPPRGRDAVMFKSSRQARHRSFASIYTPPTNDRARRSSKEMISASTELSLDTAAELLEENLWSRTTEAELAETWNSVGVGLAGARNDRPFAELNRCSMGTLNHGNISMTDNDSWANHKMRAVQSPASISQEEERRDTRAQLFRACSLLALALVIGAAALFLSHGGSQDSQLSTQAARSTISPGTR